MRTLHSHRRWLLPWVAAAMLWAQWLVVAHACPVLTAAAEGGAAVVAVPMAGMPGCTGHEGAAEGTAADAERATMDPGQQQLCKAHCQAGQQSVNSQTAALDAPPVPLHCAALVGWVVPAEPIAARAGWSDTGVAGPPRGAPPLYLSLLVLRN